LSAVAHINDYKTGKFYRDDFRGDISWNGYEHNVLLRNEGPDSKGALQFSDVAMATGADDIRDARGTATADFDNDGDLDVVINNNPGDSGRAELSRATLLRNNVGERRNWLAIELRGTESNRDGIGTRLEVVSGGHKQTAERVAGSGYLSQNDSRMHFGLGAATSIEQLTIHWPSGREQVLRGVAVDRVLTVEEPK